MVKPEWGTKRICPKCATRFYDLGKEDPIHCIECGNDFMPDPVLKSKQPMAFEAAPATPKEKPDQDLANEEDIVDEDAEVSPDEEVDLETGDNDLGVEATKEDDEN
ncbi:MAG: TIGR02300 family protein [Sphingomicrobium sp.]